MEEKCFLRNPIDIKQTCLQKLSSCSYKLINNSKKKLGELSTREKNYHNVRIDINLANCHAKKKSTIHTRRRKKNEKIRKIARKQ